eukprot:6993356-Alexandrium_andersonii.AAC.1
MSASLVGSEMCIRDRGGDEDGKLAAESCCQKALALHELGKKVTRWSITCLLYTSDAADDM